MLNMDLKRVAAGVFAAQLAIAMAPLPGAQAPVAHFVNDQGELMTVDPPGSRSQPVFVAMPLSPQAKAPRQQSEKDGEGNR
jgi:hypothetical protein